MDVTAVAPPLPFGLWFWSSFFWTVFRVRRVGGFLLVSVGGSRRRPGRAPSCFLSSFRSLCCCSRSRWRRLSFFFSGLGILSVDGSGLWFPLDVVDVIIVSVFGPFFFCGFYVLRGARQERVAACSFRHFPQVVFHPGGQPRSFLAFPAPDPGGC